MRDVVLVWLSWAALALFLGWVVLEARSRPERLLWGRPWQMSQARQWQVTAAARELLVAWDSWRSRESMGVESDRAFAQLVRAAARLDETVLIK